MTLGDLIRDVDNELARANPHRAHVTCYCCGDTFVCYMDPDLITDTEVCSMDGCNDNLFDDE